MTELKPCPFCGGGDTELRPLRVWTGKQNKITSIELMHWCLNQNGVLTVKFKAKTEEELIHTWNTRAATSCDNAAGEQE